jgi:hypothetical protein
MNTAWRVGSIGQWTNPFMVYTRRFFIGVGWDLHVRTITAVEL